LDTLVVNVHSVKMPVGFGGGGIKTLGRPVSVLAQVKRSTKLFKATENCLAHVLIIAIARIEHDSNYESYRKGKGIPEIARSQEHFREYKIVVYQGLSCDNIVFEGRD